MQDGDSRRVDVDGTIVVIARQGGEYFAFQEFCTHRFGPLSEGTYENGTVMCPWHRSCFDMRTGEVKHGPAKEPINTYPVRAGADGIVQVLVQPGRQKAR
jgi:nitrite reductase/ring-hydroxylating ferredoxin subunit